MKHKIDFEIVVKNTYRDDAEVEAEGNSQDIFRQVETAMANKVLRHSRDSELELYPICSECDDVCYEYEDREDGLVDIGTEKERFLCEDCISDLLADGELVECSECGELFTPSDDSEKRHKLCPHCLENLCQECGFVQRDDEIRVVDLDSPLEHQICQYCQESMEDSGELTRCECCGMVFSPSRLEVNPENNEKEICPYCHDVWCD